MNYEENRNRIINKYVSITSRHLNWIKLDGNAGFEHNMKVCEICCKLEQKGFDYLTRPETIVWIQSTEGSHSSPESLFPDIIYWIRNPFRTVVIEVTGTEKKEHAKNKNYPKEFKVVAVGVDEKLKELVL